MTVSYQYEVASSTSGGFTRLLFMWRGSLYKLIYRELILFIGSFGVLSALYRHAFNDGQKRIFEKMVVYCDTFINLIPLSFVLGFYVAYVAGRWWQQYMAIPWPDKIMHSIALYVNGNDEHGRMVRRTLMRYLNVTLILVLRSISSAVKRRFPTLDHVVESGFMTAIELQMYQSVPSVEFNTYWIPCTWFISLLKETRKSNRISDAQGLKIIMEEFNEFRSKCGLLWSYDWVSIPLVYTQVVTIATYSFFLAALVGRQYVDAAKKPLQMEIDIYVPVFTILQFFFFMGLLKVAEQLINPFGDDDEDFELNWLIDRHTKVSYLGVDTLMANSPPLVKDMYFDQVDLTLPYTEASVAYKKKTYRGSVHNMQVPEEKHTMFLPEIIEEDEGMSLGSSRVSVPNLHTCSSSGKLNSPPTPAAGIWRSHNETPSSSNKASEMANEFEGDNLSCQYLEVDLSSSKPFSSVFSQASERSIRSTSSSYSPVRPQKQLNRSESVPVKKAVFNVGDSVSVWPSSSTLGQSEVSVHWSEPSAERETCLSRPQENSWMLQTSDVSLNETQYRKKPLHFSSGSAFHIKTDDTVHKASNLKHWSKIKSCPKLVPIKRQNSMNSGKKKGVRWKPMIEGPSESQKREQMRRKTVDAIPSIKELFHFPVANNSCKACHNALNFLPNVVEQYNRFDLNTESNKNGFESVPNIIGSQNRPQLYNRNISLENENCQEDGADSCNIQSVPNISFTSPTYLRKECESSTVDLNSKNNSTVNIQIPTNLNRRFSSGILRGLNHCVDFKTYCNSESQWEHVSLPNIALSLQSRISEDKSSSNSSIDLSSFHSCSLETDVVVEKIPLSESDSPVADVIGNQNISNQIEDNHKPKAGHLVDNSPNIPTIFCDPTEDSDIYLTVRSDITHNTRHNLLDVLPWKSQSILLEPNYHKRTISSDSEDVEMVQIVVDSQSKD